MSEFKSYHITFKDPGLTGDGSKLADTFNFQKLVKYSRDCFQAIKDALKDAGFGAEDVGGGHVHPNERRMKIELSEKAFQFVTQQSKGDLAFIEKMDAATAHGGPSCGLKKGGCSNCGLH